MDEMVGTLAREVAKSPPRITYGQVPQVRSRERDLRTAIFDRRWGGERKRAVLRGGTSLPAILLRCRRPPGPPGGAHRKGTFTKEYTFEGMRKGAFVGWWNAILGGNTNAGDFTVMPAVLVGAQNGGGRTGGQGERNSGKGPYVITVAFSTS